MKKAVIYARYSSHKQREESVKDNLKSATSLQKIMIMRVLPNTILPSCPKRLQAE